MGFARRHPFVTSFVLVAALVLGVVGTSALAVWRAAHVDEASAIDRADVIIVLGAAHYGGQPSPVFRGRLDHGSLLYRNHFADRIVVVGAKRPGDTLSEAEAGANYLVESGVPPYDVSISPRGETTYESLKAAANFMEARDMESAFLVSDPWHNLRIRRMARDLGIEGYVSATWHSAAKSQSTRLSGYARETFAYLYYRMFRR
ncbi:MAG TPA: YdcF family protein [Actinomycetota bacterium]|nr:YdcF family protein [Actinomycetota bacterium]